MTIFSLKLFLFVGKSLFPPLLSVNSLLEFYTTHAVVFISSTASTLVMLLWGLQFFLAQITLRQYFLASIVCSLCCLLECFTFPAQRQLIAFFGVSSVKLNVSTDKRLMQLLNPIKKSHGFEVSLIMQSEFIINKFIIIQSK